MNEELIEFQVNNIIANLGLMLDSKEFKVLTLQVERIIDEARNKVFEVIIKNPAYSGIALVNVIKEELK